MADSSHPEPDDVPVVPEINAEAPIGAPLDRRRIALAGAAIGLGIVVVLVALVLGGGDAVPTAADPSSSAVAPDSATPTPTPRRAPSPGPFSSASPAAAPSASPSGPAASNSDSFAILPGQQPADFVSGITCSGPIGPSDPVAIVGLHADPPTGESVLRNYADPGDPRNACTLGTNGLVKLIDAQHLVVAHFSAVSGEDYAVVDIPEVRFHWFRLPSGPDFRARFFAVSPQLDAVTWLKTGAIGANREVHVTRGTGDHVVAELPNWSDLTCSSPEFSLTTGYSRSGAHFFVLTPPSGPITLYVFEGEGLVYSVAPPSGGWPAGGHPAMAIWSPTSETLYYRQGDDVWRWTPQGATRFLPGVHWFYPTITPDGRHLSYSTSRPGGGYDVYLMDLVAGGSPQLITQSWRQPRFLNDTDLWIWKPSVPGCGGDGGEEPFIYDITDGSEAPSIVDSVGDVWPATSWGY